LNRSGSWSRSKARVLGVVLILLAVELTFFVNCHYTRWSRALPALGKPATQTGAGLIIRSDGLGYYAWLRSCLLDGDWDFDNEFDDYNVVGDFVPVATMRTPLGRRTNPWSVGPACVWALTVVPVHAILCAVGPGGTPWPADGYSLPYQLAAGCTTLVFSGLGLFFIYQICLFFTEATQAALTAVAMTLGTSIVYYNTIEVSMAHGIGTTVVAALVWYWMRSFGRRCLRRWFSIGLLVGAAALVRWQLVTLALLPAGEALLSFCRFAGLRALVGSSLAALLGAVLGFTPQLIAWRCVYGSWLAQPIVAADNWLYPPLDALLWSQDRGLFYWTPLSGLAFLGLAGALVYGSRSRCSVRGTAPLPSPCQRETQADQATRGHAVLALLLLAFAAQVYVLASLWGNGVYLGVSFGMRHLTEVQVLLAPGLALLLNRVSQRIFPGVAAGVCCLLAWNLLLVTLFYRGALPANAGADGSTLVQKASQFLQRGHALLLSGVFLPAILLWLLAVAQRTVSADDPSVAGKDFPALV
jgi:hypothetical protein